MDDELVAVVVDLDAERAHGRERRLGVAGAARSRGRRVSPSETAPSRSARCEIDLSPGTAKCPSSRTAGSTLIDAPPRRRRCTPAHSSSVAARCASPSPLDEQRQRAAALGRDVVQLEVLDVDPLGAERLRDAGEHARPVGDVDAQPLQRARDPGTRARACAGGCSTPRRSSGRGSPRRPARARPRPARSGGAARRARRGSRRRCRGRCRSRCAGSRRRCGSCRGASRRRARAARARRCATHRSGSRRCSRARAARGSSSRRAGRARRRRSRPASRRGRRRSRGRACAAPGRCARSA